MRVEKILVNRCVLPAALVVLMLAAMVVVQYKSTGESIVCGNTGTPC